MHWIHSEVILGQSAATVLLGQIEDDLESTLVLFSGRMPRFSGMARDVRTPLQIAPRGCMNAWSTRMGHRLQISTRP